MSKALKNQIKEYYELHNELKSLKKRQDSLRKEIINAMGSKNVVNSQGYVCVKDIITRNNLDKDALLKQFNDLTPFTKQITFPTIKVTKK